MSKTISSREFNQNVSAAKRAAASRPVFITDRGRPSLVLMSIDHYERLTGTDKNIVEQLAMPGPYIEFEPGRLEPLGLDVPDLS